MESEKDCCKGDCENTMKERMNYFTGRHLAARDFQDEQQYHRTHRFLHNRMLHGWGVVCGLQVRQHAQADCRNRFVTVSPGMAIDCCGREILVDGAICCGDEQPEIPWKDYNQSRPWLILCLSYDEEGKAKVPVLSSEGDCSSSKTEVKYGRYKESWKISWHWVAKSDLVKYSWKAQYAQCPPPGEEDETENNYPDQAAAETDQEQPAPDQPHPNHPQVYPPGDCPHDDCGDPCEEGFRSCLAARCPPGHCVPLALICVNPGQPVTDRRIIMKGRPEVPSGPQRLTHIVNINWPHGGVVSPSWLQRNNPLVVRFDRKLIGAPSDFNPGPWGVNQATFVLQFGGGREDLDFVDYDDPPHLSQDGLKAEYKIGQRRQEDRRPSRDPQRDPRSRRDREAGYGEGAVGYDYLVNHTILITLKCDFLYDCHGVRVDGNNDGIAGGTFESWFSVVSDDYYNENYREERQNGEEGQ